MVLKNYNLDMLSLVLATGFIVFPITGIFILFYIKYDPSDTSSNFAC
jgi:hypothetical protein